MKKLISRKRKYSFKKKMQSFKQALAQEKQETIEMLSIYKKFTKRTANKAEMKIAHTQFFDLLKGCGLGVFALLPLAPITIPILLKVGKMIGVDLMPTSFNEKTPVKNPAQDK
ncbi:hypothetical protein [uncultured Psychrosphaera sp.]|uniref:hypothetical protein n=1 Tax=uncultured Psychrosphaera sp. TaxID=1403522 RepID=UPI00261682E0|nr:hypothetical protein [uncultured Psychrosphaera sp.]